MAGTVDGGRRAAATNKQRYGDSFYKLLGRKGGKISRGGGFAVNRELASEAGRKGGQTSRRSPRQWGSDYLTLEEEKDGQRQLRGLS